MSFTKLSTLTSGVLAIADTKMIGNTSCVDLNIVHSHNQNLENILVVDKNQHNISNHDSVVESIYALGFRIIISDRFTDIFSTKAINKGILPIEMSRAFIDKVVNSSKNNNTKLFIDINGQEAMIINSGEKEFFKLSDYFRESFESDNDDIDSLYSVWDDMDLSFKREEILEYAIE